jgi:heat-inducible transcriptional repressor
LAGERTAALEQILGRAAKVLGVLTNELGVAVSPSLDAAVLERLELLQVSTERLMLVLTLKSGVVRTIFVEVPSQLAPDVLVEVTLRVNERLAGLSLREIRATLSDRLRDVVPDASASELINIFIQEADDLFDVPAAGAQRDGVLLGSTQPLAGQPEFATKERLQGLIGVTERRDVLREVLNSRAAHGVTITIGSEHADPSLAPFTLVTSSYRSGPLSGVIGVMGPTRMAYDKIVALVDHTSRLVGDLLQ